MLSKLSFLKNKTLAYIAIGAVALFNGIAVTIDWAQNGFVFGNFVLFLIGLVLLSILILSLFLKNEKGILISIGAYFFNMFVSQFSSSITLLNAFSSLRADANYICFALFMLLCSLTVLISFVLFILKAFFASNSFSKATNIIVCLVGFVFALVAFGLNFSLSEVSASMAFALIEFALFSLADIIVSFNID